MTDTRKIRVADGRRVRIPGTYKPLSAAGETVTWSSYWQRRLAAGDVELVDDRVASAPAAVKPQASPIAAAAANDPTKGR